MGKNITPILVDIGDDPGPDVANLLLLELNKGIYLNSKKYGEFLKFVVFDAPVPVVYPDYFVAWTPGVPASVLKPSGRVAIASVAITCTKKI